MKLGTYVCVAGVPAGQDCSMTSGMRHSAIHLNEQDPGVRLYLLSLLRPVL